MDIDSNSEFAPLREKITSKCCHLRRNRTNIQRSTTVSLNNLFRFATTSDVCLIISAALFAVLNGLCLPITIILYGDISVAFVSDAIQGKGNVSASHCDLNNRTNSQSNMTESIESSQNLMEAVIEFCLKTTFLHVTSTILSFIFVVASNCAAENQIYYCRSACMKAVLHQEMGWYDTQKTEGLASRFSEDLLKMQDGIGEKLGMILSNLSATFFCVLVAFYYGWELSLITAGAFPILAFSTGILAKVQMSFATQETAAYGDAGSLAEEIIGAIRTVTIFSTQEKEVRNFESALFPALKAGIKRGLASAAGNALTWLITYASYALAFWYGVELVLTSYCSTDGPQYDAASLNIVFFSMLFAAMKAGQILPLLDAVNVARVAAVNVYAIIDRNPLIRSLPKSSSNQLSEISGDITFENANFAYPSRPDVPILKGISFTAKAGETVALVGASGCGKSTCLQLMQRFYDPQLGRILLDGIDIKNVDLQWLRAQIGFVGQEPILFGVSVGDNIRYGALDDRNVSQADIERAAKLANAHSFIEKLPHGYNTMVGERGAQLSGGQKQRIAIARALVRRPKILLFDEATSALDNHSEALVQKAIDEARMGHTTLVVAHRLSTVRNADKIMVFKEGAIEEEGNHESLMMKQGLYYQLVKSQDIEFGELKNTAQLAKGNNGSRDTHEINGAAKKLQVEVNSLTEKKPDTQRNSINNNISIEDSTLDHTNSPEVSIWRILEMNRQEHIQVLLGLAGSAMLGITTPLYSVVFGEVMGLLGQPEAEDIEEQLDFYVLMFLALAFGAGLGAFLQIFMFSYAGEHLTFRLRKLTFRSVLRKRIEWFDSPENSVGALCARLSNDASAIQGATGGRIGILTQVIVSIAFAFLLSFYYDWKLALACGVFVPIVLASTVIGMKINMGVNGSRARALEQSAAVAAEAISNIRTVASLGREKTFHSSYMRSLVAPYRLAKQKSYVRGLVFGFTSNASSFASIVCMGFGGYLVQSENLDYKYVFIICEALIFGMEMIGQTIAFTPDYGKAKAAANRVFNLIDSDDDSTSLTPLTSSTIARTEGGLSLEDMYFSYPTRKNVQVLKGFTAFIQPGQTVALVGPSGCGKSTCIQLLQRFYDLDRGYMYLDDQSIETLDVDSYRSNLGVVSQEPCLFNRTIAENIAYGDQTREVKMDEIIKAAKKANIHSFVQSLPLGYETKVGQRGAQLSGGQKQRIAIARMLLRNPKILILDEATSALDAASERVVQEALDNASRDCTCVVIAHRLSTIVKAHKILVVHHGIIQEEGTHEELIRKEGMYHRLWTLQGFGDN